MTSPTTLLAAHEEQELLQLWVRRIQLKKDEWARLWCLVHQVLARCHPAVLGQLVDSKEDLIEEFFLSKVLETRYADTRLDSARALATFFHRFLLDRQRHQARRPVTYVNDEKWIDHAAESEGDDGDQTAPVCRTLPDDNVHQRHLLASAVSFFEELSRDDQLYLSLHACEDDGEPLYLLAKRFEIASYHYKAGQLGITRKKGELSDGYATTKIGRWLTRTLGLTISTERMSEILEAFEALCEAAMLLRNRLTTRYATDA